MASALAAFAYGLHAGQEQTRRSPTSTPPEDDADLVESEDETPSAADANSLLAVARQQQEASRPTQSLVQLAQKQQEKRDDSTRSPLAALAGQVNGVQAITSSTKSALHTTAELLQTQAQQQAIDRPVQQALVEDQQQYQHDDDDFEDDDDADVAIRGAAALLVGNERDSASNTDRNKPGSARPPTTGGHACSVDRQVLQQRQNRRGLESKSVAKAATMKDKLSTFQFGQLSLAQRRVFLATLAGDSNTVRAKNKPCNMVLHASPSSWSPPS